MVDDRALTVTFSVDSETLTTCLSNDYATSTRVWPSIIVYWRKVLVGVNCDNSSFVDRIRLLD